MKITISLLALGLAACGAAQAGVTNIAQVPLMNVEGTGSVKPNLVLIYDNSGSMDFEYTPDVIANATTICRAGASLAAAKTTCALGHPPYTAAEFNKQYYNPKVRYTPAVKSDGTPFSLSAYGIASPWTAVRMDPFLTTATANIVTGWSDLKWCSKVNGTVTTDCKFNTSTYTYPDATYNSPVAFKANPYYYSINVSEYCSDSNLTSCQSVKVGAEPPAGFPYPAKVRWCTDTALTTANCQAKTDKTHIYPRFSAAGSGGTAYGTLSIGATETAAGATINSVSINEINAGVATAVVITNGAITAPSGTVTNTNRKAMAYAVAASINAKSGLTNQYLACVNTPSGSAVNACSTYSINLASDYIVAVMPVTCTGSNKLTQCTTMADGARAGWNVNVAVNWIPPTALLTVSGTSGASFSLSSLSFGSTPLFGSGGLALPASTQSASQVATAIMNKVNAQSGSTVKAYAAGNSVTPTCSAQSGSGTICLVDTNSGANGATLSLGDTLNTGSILFTAAKSAGADGIPVSTAALSAGGDIFVRTDIIPGKDYPKWPDRSDCAASLCSYAEEMNNFATWHAFYRDRNTMMKTSVGQAFAGVTDRYRVGLAILSAAAAAPTLALSPDTFTNTPTNPHRDNFYTKLYAVTLSGSTPMRLALHNVGKVFKENKDNKIVTELCQQNFVMITTDGYWNGGTTTDVTDNDVKEDATHFCTKAKGCVDSLSPNTGGNSLADVALYWYNGGSNGAPVSLVGQLPGGVQEDMTKDGKVPGKTGDNTHLHINTYTLGLGMDGIMTYDPNYEKNPDGDFLKIINGASGCPWRSGGTYSWPDVVSSSTADQQSRVDDLWHAAVNGRGKYFSASVPAEVVHGVTEALNNMAAKIGAGSAAATSTPNITQSNNDIFSDTYTTGKWNGELSAQKIDPVTGDILAKIYWSTSSTLGAKVAAASDTRTIYKFDASVAGTKLKDFKYSSLTSQEKGWFDNRCTEMAQCTMLTAAQRNIVNNGDNLVNWLRGQQQYADDTLYRAYSTKVVGSLALPIVLGDIVSSKPAYQPSQRRSYDAAGYQAFMDILEKKPKMVFVAANDGMLHAFDALTGDEKWAYVPRVTMKKLARQASTEYGASHQYTTDGSPEVNPVFINGEWRSVLIAGFGGGGRGFYALDVTEPTAPKALWEICADPAICSISDPNIGLTLGNAQIGMWNGAWVAFVTSGYNNVPTTDGINSGDGVGHLYIIDIGTGKIVKDLTTNGDPTTPSGLARITAISANPYKDPKITFVFGGDDQGQMWRFDVRNPASTSVAKMGVTGPTHPITTRPDVSQCIVETKSGEKVLSRKLSRVVLFGTGRLLSVPDTIDEAVQSLYLVKDSDETRPLVDLRGTTMIKQKLAVKTGLGYTISQNKVDLNTDDGWYLDWDLNKRERMNLDPKIVNGGVNFVTNIPGESTACSVGGTSNVYQVELCTGSTPTPGDLAGGIMSNSATAVGFVIVRLDSGILKMVTTLADGNKEVDQVRSPYVYGARSGGWRRVRN